MKRLRQIVTKAVIAKGKKRTECSETLRPPNVPTSILGCWVINHQHQAKKVGKFVEVSGKFDVNVWYAFNNHSKTAVFTETISYKDRIKLKYRDEEICDSTDVRVRVLQQPNCIEAVITPNGEQFNVVIEREFLVEVIGETTICISVHPLDFEEEWSFEDESSIQSSSSSSSSSSCSSISGFGKSNESSSFS
ncbi:outer spore coat protein CotE [Solibacillus sp. FSL H8-0538]|uniref:outer spore coat protein CotE n=1 Tax=Solibacillus sp. FSL H8-0538 TaxID=2921400 RepID=UPI0030F50325